MINLVREVFIAARLEIYGHMISVTTGAVASPASSLQRNADCCQRSPCADVQHLPFPQTFFLIFILIFFIKGFLIRSSPITAPQSGQLPPPALPQACKLSPFPVVALLAQAVSFLAILVHRVTGLDPLNPFRIIRALIPSTNSPREAASNLSASTDFWAECFSGLHGVLPAVSDIRINRIYL